MDYRAGEGVPPNFRELLQGGGSVDLPIQLLDLGHYP